MKLYRRLLKLTALILVVVFIFLRPVIAGLGDPAIYFTNNFAANSPSQTITEMEQALLNIINGASISIDASIYDFNRISVRDALIAAKNRGVVVQMVTDDDSYSNADYAPYFAALEAAGIPVIQDARSSIMHNKFFIVDDRYVWTGSTNITDRGFTYNHNNSIIFDSTTLASIYTIEFDEMFGGLFGTAKSDNTTHSITYDGSPLEIYFSPSDGALLQVIEEVNAASNTIRFSIFSFTDDGLRDALIAAKNRGVDVIGVWDALGAGNQYSDDEALCAAGIPVKIENFGGILHNKFMVIDVSTVNPVVVTGSMNWSASGATSNDENTVLFYDMEAAAAYDAAWQGIYNALPESTLCDMPASTSMFIFLPIITKPVPPTPTPLPTNPPVIPTNTPVPTSTPIPTTSNVVLSQIVYNPAGDDVAGERVLIVNIGSAAQNMQGWTLADNANHVYTFPAFTLQAGASVNVWVKAGGNTTTDLYWGSGAAIWNNTGDTAYLRSNQGITVDSCIYAGGGEIANCN